MKNAWSILCYLIAFILLIGGIIVTLVFAVKLESWLIFLYGASGSFVSFVIIGTLGYIAGNVGANNVSQEYINRTIESRSEDAARKALQQTGVEMKAETFSDGKWRCKCGRINEKYVSTCACGLNKRDILV